MLQQVPLEVTHTAIVSSDILSQIQALNSDFANISVSLLTCFAETYRDLFNFKDGPPLHDPVAVAYVADPNIFEVCIFHSLSKIFFFIEYATTFAHII